MPNNYLSDIIQVENKTVGLKVDMFVPPPPIKNGGGGHMPPLVPPPPALPTPVSLDQWCLIIHTTFDIVSFIVIIIFGRTRYIFEMINKFITFIGFFPFIKFLSNALGLFFLRAYIILVSGKSNLICFAVI